MRIVSAGWHPSNTLYCVTQQERHNALYHFDFTQWKLLLEWHSDPTVSCCRIDRELLLGTIDGRIWRCSENSVTEVKHGIDISCLYASAQVAPDTVLFGGERGRLLELCLRTNEFKSDRLGRHGIRRPGRDILCIKEVCGQTFVLGERGLCVQIVGSTVNEPLDRASLGQREFFFLGAAAVGDNTVFSGSVDGLPFVGRLNDDGGLRPIEELSDDPSKTAEMCQFGDAFAVACEDLRLGHVGDWQQVVAMNGEVAVCLFPDPQQRLYLVCESRRVLTWEGGEVNVLTEVPLGVHE